MPLSPVPGERLQVFIIDRAGRIVRRFDQIEGRCIDPGYVDFFLSHNRRPAIADTRSTSSVSTSGSPLTPRHCACIVLNCAIQTAGVPLMKIECTSKVMPHCQNSSYRTASASIEEDTTEASVCIMSLLIRSARKRERTAMVRSTACFMLENPTSCPSF
jgi:hypothetical protein